MKEPTAYLSTSFTLAHADKLVDCGETSPHLSTFEISRQAEEAAAFSLMPPTPPAPKDTTLNLF